MSSRIPEADRQAFARIVDILLPAAHGMPAGQAVGVAAEGLDKVIRLRPDIVPDLLRGIRLFAQASALDPLQVDAEAWHAVRLAAYGAYYTTAPVQAILRYTGQISQPFDPDETPAYLTDGALRPVIERGPIWTKV
jgi:hypothetical protein